MQSVVCTNHHNVQTIHAGTDHEPARAPFGNVVNFAQNMRCHGTTAFIAAAKKTLRSSAIDTRRRV